MPEEANSYSYGREHRGEASTDKKPKNIVICCDGTGNKFGGANSNVVKLYTALIIDNDQVGYYHPGVGTMGAPGTKGIKSLWSQVKGLAFAAGFKDNVLDAYRYLMEVYDDGDRVYLFGFSRGSYTARALAGMLHGYGLLCRGNEGHIPYVWQMFVDAVKDKKEHGGQTIDPAEAFKETYSHPQISSPQDANLDGKFSLHFVGLWDTVSSVGWIRTPLRLLDIAQNPLIEHGRHAVSIDERRCFYQDNLWGDALAGQDIVQAWFAGVHSDVGGSYPQKESQLANTALKWLLDEASKPSVGLKVEPDRVRLIFGEPTQKQYAAEPLYEKPAPYWIVHPSLKGLWWLLEVLPHRYYDKDDAAQNWRIPLGSWRKLPPDSLLHPSVAERMRKHGEYRPDNVPIGDVKPSPLAGAIESSFYRYQPVNPKHGSKAGRWLVLFVFIVLELLLAAGLLWLVCKGLAHVHPVGWTVRLYQMVRAAVLWVAHCRF